MLRNKWTYIYIFMSYNVEVVFAFSHDLKYRKVGLPDEIFIYVQSTLSMLIDCYINTAIKKIYR